MFKNLTIENWRQFQRLDISFHPRVTIITGPNAAGKSTAINILSSHYGYQKHLLSTPQLKKKGGLLFSIGKFLNLNKRHNSDEKTIGSIIYTNNRMGEIRLPDRGSLHFNLSIDKQQVDGLHIDSHRPITNYAAVPNISFKQINPIKFLNSMNGVYSGYFSSGQINAAQNSIFHLKSALIELDMYGYGAGRADPIEEYREYLDGFIDKLRLTLPRTFGFRDIKIVNQNEVMIESDFGNFLIDSCSGGIIKIIEITWIVYLKSKQVESFTVTMDEPENHLHPSMQRTFISDLVSAFPSVQFIIATHSPFVVTSIRDSRIYALREVEGEFVDAGESENSQSAIHKRKYVSEELDAVHKAAPATNTLRDVLGVPATIPTWANERAEEIVSKYKNASLNEGLLDKLYEELASEGLVAEFPQAIAKLQGH